MVDWREVEAVAREAERDGGAVGVAARAPDGGTFSYNGERRFRAASTVKIPIMVEVYRQVERGERALDDPYTLTAEGKTPGSGVLLHLHDGIGLTLNDLIYLMMSISDNTATNILIDMAGMERVNATMRSLGMTDSTLGRKMTGGRPLGPGEQENWATPLDYVRAVDAILAGRAASAESCARMVEMLRKQQNARRIARFVPSRDGVEWGSKTGTIAGVVNDAGFVRTPAGTLVLAVFCENPADSHTGERVIGEVSRAALAATGILEPLQTS